VQQPVASPGGRASELGALTGDVPHHLAAASPDQAPATLRGGSKIATSAGARWGNWQGGQVGVWPPQAGLPAGTLTGGE
jgi:hypothetical protein